ncbi:hypothetical protein D3C73_942670 [compost metagenome]
MRHVRRLHGPHASRAQPGPDLPGKGVQGGQAHLERENRVRAKAGRDRSRVDLSGRDHDRRTGFQVRGHDGARLAPGLDVPFGDQEGIGRIYGSPGQTQLTGQRPRRRDPVAGLQDAAGDGSAEAVVDLPVERFLRRGIQRGDFGCLRDRHGTFIW